MLEPSQRLVSALAAHTGGEPLQMLEVGFSFAVLATRALVFRLPRTSAAAARLDSERALLAHVRHLPFAVPVECLRLEVSADIPFAQQLGARRAVPAVGVYAAATPVVPRTTGRMTLSPAAVEEHARCLTAT